jgi:ketosteroid isomerase-like protein
MIPMRYIIILLLAVSSCSLFEEKKKDHSGQDAIQELQRADQDFADFSKKHGMRKAFLEFIDDEGVMMHDNSMPLRGAPAIEYISSMNDSSVSLTWEPLGGEVATSGELGYTYGVYEMKDSANVQEGTYVTIWKKKNGKWKFVLETVNQGLQ